MSRHNRNRKEIYFSGEEWQLLQFAQRCYGLDMTNTVKLLCRLQAIELIIRYRETGVPKLPADLEKFADNF